MKNIFATTNAGLRESAARALEGAARWLESHRWIQFYAGERPDGYQLRSVFEVGQYPNEVTACCAAGAIARELGLGQDKTYEIAREAVSVTTCAGTPFETLARWNDKSGRTKEEVLFALRAGADYLRAADGGAGE